MSVILGLMFSLIFIWGNHIAVIINSHYFNIINKYIPLWLFFIMVYMSICTLQDEVLNNIYNNGYLAVAVLCMLSSSLYCLYLLTINTNCNSSTIYKHLKIIITYLKMFCVNILYGKISCKKIFYTLFVIIILTTFFLCTFY